MTKLHTSDLYAADGRHEYSVDDLRPYFLGESGLPMPIPHADLIHIAPARRGTATIGYSFVSDLGYSLDWERYDAQGQRRPTMMSVWKKNMMGIWKENPDQSVFPVGSLVPGEVAIRVIEDFARNPEVLSDAVEWVDETELDWPDP